MIGTDLSPSAAGRNGFSVGVAVGCHFSWNRDPATGLIFIQSGPQS